MREAAGWFAALGTAVAVVAQVAASDRSALLFRDGDSLVVAMFARSALSDVPLDWAMSSVLFLPESAVFLVLDALLPFDLDGVLAVNAVVNLLALYGALRLAAGRRRPGGAPVAWSLLALGLVGLVAATETSASRDALELASLLLTTTYYSATVVAVVAVVGVLRRALDDGARPGVAELIVGAVAAASTLTNPLFAAWASVPLTVVLVALTRRPGDRRRLLALAGSLLGGTVLGMVARIPFSAWIANTGAGYAQPERWAESLRSYADLLAARISEPPGALAALLVAALLALSIVRTARSTSTGERLVAASGWVVPLLVVVGAIALGTHAARYLQPVVFAPVLSLVAAPAARRLSATAARTAVAAASVALVVGGVLGILRLAAAVQRPDADLDCVTSWVAASHRTGAGQFWTVRLPKAHLDDPSRLVQVDHRLNGYAWLVNRTDLDAGAVSYLVEDAQTVPWDLPVDVTADRIVPCGRYRILDYGDRRIPLGPAHS